MQQYKSVSRKDQERILWLEWQVAELNDALAKQVTALKERMSAIEQTQADHLMWLESRWRWVRVLFMLGLWVLANVLGVVPPAVADAVNGSLKTLLNKLLIG